MSRAVMYRTVIYLISGCRAILEKHLPQQRLEDDTVVLSSEDKEAAVGAEDAFQRRRDATPLRTGSSRRAAEERLEQT